VQAAANYAAAFPEEINAALDDNASYDAQKVRRMLPQARVLTMVDDELIEEMPARATPTA
jgi:hypothetical protein